MRLTILLALMSAMFPSAICAQAPVFEITPVGSTIKFDVEASVAITGKFDKWDAPNRKYRFGYFPTFAHT